MGKIIKFIQYEKQLSNQDITEFENKYDNLLTQKYKEFILKYNGGFPSEEVEFEINGSVNEIDLFFSIKYGLQTVESRIDTYQITEKHIPIEYLPIASDPSDNPYTISSKVGEEGQIFIWYFDLPEVEKHFVANDLEEFLGGWIE